MRRKAGLVGATVVLILLSVVLVGGQAAEELHRCENREPIYIYGNEAFTCENGVVSGCGTKENPYLIEGWHIAPRGADFGIYIDHTTDHFVIRNCAIENASAAAIHFNSVTNGMIEGCQLLKSACGILLENSHYNGVVGNLIAENRSGAVMSFGSNENTFTENAFIWNDRAGYDPQRRTQWCCGQRGNYWSDYQGCDCDGNGIGDVPYSLLGDPYPLMASPPGCFLPPDYTDAARCVPADAVPGCPGVACGGCHDPCVSKTACVPIAPCVTVVADQLLTCSRTEVPLTAYVSEAGPSCSVEWTKMGEGVVGNTASITVNEPGTYTVTVTGTSGCSASGTVVVSQDVEPPVVAAIVDGPLTCTKTVAALTADVRGGKRPYCIEWTKEGQGIIGTGGCITVIEPGDYSVTVTGFNGCSATDTVTVTRDIEPPIVVAGADGALSCSVNAVNLSANVSGGRPPYRIEWTRPGVGVIGTGTSVTVTEPGTYSVIVFGANGCSASDSVAVGRDVEPPVVDAVVDEVLTCATTKVDLTANVTGGTPPYIIEWTRPGAGAVGDGARIAVGEPGTYCVTVIGANGCSASDSVTVSQDIEPPIVDAVVDAALTCVVSEVTLTANVSGGRPPYVIEWTKPGGGTAGTAEITVGEPGAYSVTVTGANGCSVSDSVTVIQNIELPTVDAGPDRVLSIGEPEVTLIATIGAGGEPYTVTWEDMEGEAVGQTESMIVSRPGTYRVTVIKATGCRASDEVLVTSTMVKEVLLESDIEGLAVFGQLTLDGVPIPDSVFYLHVGLTHPPAEDATVTTIRLTDISGQGYEANGAEINYIIPGNSIVTFEIHKEQFIAGKKYWLLHLPTDPPGAASVAFF